MLSSILNIISVLSSDGCSFIQNLSCYLPLVSPFLKGRVVFCGVLRLPFIHAASRIVN